MKELTSSAKGNNNNEGSEEFTRARTVRNFKLEGVEALRIDDSRYPLTEVSPEELKAYRKQGVSSFVLKKNGKLYHTEIPEGINFVGSKILGYHACANCNRLSAARDEDGGCEKVRKLSRRIERYKFIIEGYETFCNGSGCEAFAVKECSNFENYPPPKTHTPAEESKLKLTLCQSLWDDVETWRDVSLRRAEALRKG